jgi:hypothetical protein
LLTMPGREAKPHRPRNDLLAAQSSRFHPARCNVLPFQPPSANRFRSMSSAHCPL